MPLPVQKKKIDALEHEQTVERPGPNSTGTGIPDGVSATAGHATPD